LLIQGKDIKVEGQKESNKELQRAYKSEGASNFERVKQINTVDVQKATRGGERVHLFRLQFAETLGVVRVPSIRRGPPEKKVLQRAQHQGGEGGGDCTKNTWGLAKMGPSGTGEVPAKGR